MNDKFSEAQVRLDDGRIAYDAAKLADIPVEGVHLKDYLNHVIVVQTLNTKYVFTSIQGRVRGQAFKVEGEPRYLAKSEVVHIHGSTWGGSMIRLGFIGVDMRLEFSTKEHNCITTSPIQSVQFAPLEQRKQSYYEQMEAFGR